MLNRYTYVGVTEGTGPALWADKVQEAVNEFAVGPTADALSALATKTIAKMLSSTAGTRQTTQK